jgi:hypothetical protein
LAFVGGAILAFLGLAGTLAVCLSGLWGIAHGWPILVLSVPSLFGGAAILRIGFKAKRKKNL